VSVRIKLIIIILFVAVVPLTVLALTTLGIHQRAFEANLTELHRRTAEHEATRLQARLDALTRGVQVLATQTIAWPELTPAERDAALWLVYRQSDDVTMVLLLDEQSRQMAQPAYVNQRAAAEEPEHPPISPALAKALIEHLPQGRLQESELAFGEVFVGPGHEAPILPVALGVGGAGRGAHWVVALGLSLRAFCQEVGDIEGFEILLADDQERVICGPAAAQPLAPVDAGLLAYMERGPGVGSYVDQAGVELVAAIGQMSQGWRVVAQQPKDLAYWASQRIRAQTIFWIGLSLAVALAAGLFLSRTISRPIDRLMAGVRQLAQGNIGHRLRMTERDEFSRLGQAFDKMSDEIATRDAEIRAWNVQLRERVEERTLELQEAHRRLLHSEKVAAAGSFSAGVASEINDPLTAVLGTTQLLLHRAREDPKRAREVELLEGAEREGQRMRGVMRRLQALAHGQTESRFSRISVPGLLDSTLALLDSDLEQKQVEVVRGYAADLPPVWGNFTQLQQAVLQVLRNALAATKEAPRIVVSALLSESEMVRIVIADNGCGIVPADLDRIFEPFFTTGDASEGAGLGLAIAQRIIEQHHGSITATSTVGEGTVVAIALPAAGPSEHRSAA
jgi:signal transduction histidine kinase